MLLLPSTHKNSHQIHVKHKPIILYFISNFNNEDWYLSMLLRDIFIHSKTKNLLNKLHLDIKIIFINDNYIILY